MLENIRNIGIFMIAAQAVIHFAPGRQYEKYIKLISSVIVLYLFLKPFLYARGDLEEEWLAGMEQMTRSFEAEELWSAAEENVEDSALEQMEEEIKTRLNESISDSEYTVNSVSLVFSSDISREPEAYRDLSLQGVEVRMGKKGENGVVEPVVIGEIEAGEGGQEGYGEERAQYQQIFAGILGIEPDRVEVIGIGGW